MAFKITAEEKALIIKRRKKLKRSKVFSSPERVAEVVDKLNEYFETGIDRITKLESIINKLRSGSGGGRAYRDLIARIEQKLNSATDDMENLRDALMNEPQ